MAPPKRPWFRFYVEAVHDRKLRRLKPETRWLFVACLAAARQSPEPGRLLVGVDDPMGWDDLIDYAGMTRKQVEQGTDALHDAGVLDFDKSTSTWFVPNWSARQYESDVSTDRTSKWRRKNDDVTPDETPPETEADTENREQSGGGCSAEVKVELDARLRRRRLKGEDIGPGLVRLILSDVERDLAIQPLPEEEREPACAECDSARWVYFEDLNGVVPCPSCRAGRGAA